MAAAAAAGRLRSGLPPAHLALNPWRMRGDQRMPPIGHRWGVTMRRSALLAVALLLAAFAVPAAAADDAAQCNDNKGEPDARLAACSTAIASGQWAGADLARLYTVRAFL